MPRKWLAGDAEEEKLLLPIKVEGKVIPQVMKLNDFTDKKDNGSVKQIEETGALTFFFKVACLQTL